MNLGLQFAVRRSSFITQAKEPTSSFWEVRHLHSKTHAVLCDQILKSLTSDGCLSREEFGRKLVSLTADGASVNGVRRGSRPISEPFCGPVGNLAHSLQQFKKEFSDEKLMCIWCSAHRVDLTAKQFETDGDFADILRLVRRISNHVSASTHAQGQLAALSKIILSDDNRKPRKLSFCPTRFLSHSEAAKTLVASFPEIVSYISGLRTGQGDHSQWASAIHAPTQTV